MRGKIKVQHCVSEMQEPREPNVPQLWKTQANERWLKAGQIYVLWLRPSQYRNRGQVSTNYIKHHLLSVRPLLAFFIQLSCDLLSATRVTFLKMFLSFCLFSSVLSAASFSLPLNRRYLIFFLCFLLNEFVMSKRKWLGSCDLRACTCTQIIYTVFALHVELRWLSYTLTMKNAEG